MKMLGRAVLVTGFVALPVLLGTGLDAQQARVSAKLPAASLPSAEAEASDRDARAARHDPVGRVTREHALRAVERFEPGSTRPESLRNRGANPIPAGAGPPEEFREAMARERAARGTRQPPAPGRDRLVEVIRSLPGGPQMIEEARRRGAPIGAAKSRVARFLAWMNPFRAREARAQAKYSFALTPTNPFSSSPYGYLYFNSVSIAGDPNLRQLKPFSYSLAGLTTSVIKPFAEIGLTVPADGWYVINVRGYSSGESSARLVAFGSRSVVSTWDYKNPRSWQDFPALLQLSKGSHWFRFVNVGTGSYNTISVSRVDAFAL